MKERKKRGWEVGKSRKKRRKEKKNIGERES